MIFFLGGPVAAEPLEDARFEIIDWEYHWGDFPVRPAPEYYQIDESQAQWTPFVSERMRPPERGEHTVGWMRTKLPENLNLRNPGVFFPGFDLVPQIFLQHERIFAYDSAEFIGFRQALLHLPANYAGSYLYIRLYSNHTNLGIFRGAYVDDYESLTISIVRTHAGKFSIGIFFLAAAFIMLLVAFLNWERKEIPALALTFALSGLVLVFVPTNALTQLFVPHHLITHLLFQYSMYTVPVPFSIFVERMFPARRARGFAALRVVIISFAVFSLGLSLAGLIPHMSSFLLGEILLLVACAVVMARVFQALWYREAHSFIFGLGSLLIVLGTVRDVLAEIGVLDSTSFPVSLHFWVLAFFICMIVALVRSITTTYRLADRYLGEVKRLNLQLERKVEEQTQEINMILQTIEQGILIIDEKGRITQDHSRYSLQLLGENELARQDLDRAVLSKTDLTEDQRQQMIHILGALIDEDLLTWELNNPSFPRFFHLKAADGSLLAIEAEWTPFVNDQERISHILLTLRDVTEILQYRQEVQAHEDEWKNVEELVHVPVDKLRLFLEHGLQLVRSCQEALKADEDQAYKICLRHLHTLKGNARTLGMRRMSGALHSCEDRLLALRDEPYGPSIKNSLTLEIDGIESRLLEYNHLNIAVLNRGGTVDLRDRELQPVPLKSLLDECQPAITLTAEKLKKPVPHIVWQGVNPDMPVAYSLDLKDVFMHLITNALDHGIEDAATRLQQGKSAEGHIFVKVFFRGRDLYLEWRDDGRGLDLKVLRRKMPELMDDEHIARSIFQDHISSRSSISELSGRGLGLAAVRQFFATHDSSIDIILDPAAPGADFRTFAFLLKLPYG